MAVAGDSAGHDATAGRRTSTMVRLQDRAAEVVITSGGLLVLLAMLGICLFLVTSVAPLFVGGRITGETARFEFENGPPEWVALDPAFDRFLTLEEDGVFRVRAIGDGSVLAHAPALEDGSPPGAISVEAGDGWVTITKPDGTFEIVRTDLSWEPAEVSGDPKPGRTLNPGDSPDVYSHRIDDGTRRLWTLGVKRLGPFKTGQAVIAVDSRGKTERLRQFAAVDEEQFISGTLRGRRALGSGSIRYRASMDEGRPFAGEDRDRGPPDWVFASGSGVWIYGAWETGEIVAVSREADSVVRSALGSRVTTAAMSLGSETLLLGDEAGGVSGWSVRGQDGTLQAGLRRGLGSAAVTAIRPGDRDRTIMVGFADGSAVMYNTVSDKVIVKLEPGGTGMPGGVAHIAASPDSGVVMVIDESGRAVVTGVEPGHTGVSFSALFSKVQYEGYDEPAYVYQSTGSASAEPKFSLVPLVFGTLKATVVAMLLAVPMAVLAAVYSSEFLHPRVRRYVKPTIELMASLPSVVLGFIAAMAVAPFVRDYLPVILVFGATGPMVVVLAAHAWRLIPHERRTAWGTFGQFGLIGLALAAGIAAAIPAGGVIEGLLFSPGNGGEASIRSWLNGDFGVATPGWFVALLMPVVCVLLSADVTVLDPIWRRLADRVTGLWVNLFELVRLVVNLLIAFSVTWALGAGLDAAGFDPRDSIFGPFSQRNTLVVGMIMGIAVIPIIYTISEDAIRSVPNSLRSASLGVGATPWQTALRVVLPVAGSGIFSAIMIGLGRAVGETMIVLMATGNTPEMSMNIFSGFRTLAANIAVELPEAPRASTHYRVLFLCGLVLFAMTLVINTTAELVRQHFRKRNAAL